MGDANRFRHGRRLLVEVPVASATVIEKGDFVVLSSGKAVLPSALHPAGSRAATATVARDAAADAFLGICETPSASGETTDILVDISLENVYELVQATAENISFGDNVAIMANSTASASWVCADNSIDTVANGTTNPIAVCVKDKQSTEGTGTKVKFLPTTVLHSTAAID